MLFSNHDATQEDETAMQMFSVRNPGLGAALTLLLATLMACTPTVKVEAPDKPIEINMNINIRHEILVKVERAVEEMFENEALF